MEGKKHFIGAGRKLFFDSRSALEGVDKIDVLRTFGSVPRVVAFVPAKGHSVRVKGKNTRELGGKPLFLHVLDTLLQSHVVDEVYLDTDSDEIINLAGNRGHKVIKRPSELATNATDGNQLFLFEASQVPGADIYLQVLPTAPFLSTTSIDRAVYSLIRSTEHDSVFGTQSTKKYLWTPDGHPTNYDPLQIPNSVDLDATVEETMGLYAIRKYALLERKARIGFNPILFNLPQIECVDIDTEEDFLFAETLYRGRIANE